MTHGNELALSLQDLTRCITRLTSPEPPPASLEALGPELVRELHGVLLDSVTGAPAAALVRFFMTVPYGSLPEEKQRFARERFPDLALTPDTKCLTLMGTFGDEPAWCDVSRSEGHQAIPLVSEEWVESIPMIARLFSQLGLQTKEVLEPKARPSSVGDRERFDVFYVPDARSSPYIPARESFVEPHGVASVLGFGSMLPTGHVCVVLLFSKARISEDTAKLFLPLALGVRMAVLPLVEERIHAGAPGAFDDVERLRARHAAQSELLSVYRDTVVDQADRLDRALADLRSTNDHLHSTLNALREARSRLAVFEAGIVSRYAMEKLRDPGTYKVAFVVGTLINAFGHFLVPYLRGRPDVLQRFTEELHASPGLVILSVVIAYLFPVAVQVHSAVTSRMRGHAAELRAEFPNSKPDPVFRAAPDGRIVDAGDTTARLLERHHIERAQDVVGEELWERVLALQAAGRRLPAGTRVRVEAMDASYLVTHAPSEKGAVNFYLTEVGEDG